MNTAQTAMANWKNVNNWHWIEKNCTLWSHDYLREAFKQLHVQDQGIKWTVQGVDKLEGDVDIRQRKGKVLYFYELNIKLSWQAESPEAAKAASAQSSGTLSIAEWSHEALKPSELAFQVEIQKESCQISKATLLQMLRGPLFDLLKQFQLDLEKVQGPTMIASHSAPPPPPPSLGQNVAEEKHKAPALPPATLAPKDSAFATSTLHQTVEFAARPSDIYSLLVDPEAIKIWTRGPVLKTPKSSNKKEEEFQILDGNVVFSFTERSPEHSRLAMRWRFQGWPTGHDSMVHIELSSCPEPTRTRLVLKQTSVPCSDLERMKQNWKEYYWNSIKRIYGYGPLD